MSDVVCLASAKQSGSIMPKFAGKKLPFICEGNYLPDFCNAEVFLRLLLVIELVAIVFSLISFSTGSLYLQLALLSILMQWIGLTSAAVLCLLSRWGTMRTILVTTLIAFGVGLASTIAATLVGDIIAGMMQLSIGINSIGLLLLRNLSVTAILTGLALRYFYLQYESRIILETQARARLQALQARIRPHFLFNSMNTIASLTHDQPDLAEQAIENLSDLFRASLAAKDRISLQQELELTRSYIQLETLRLGDRLTVNWSMPEADIELLMPALILQPLVENAIYHGVEPLADGGVIDISIDRYHQFVRIVISNPLLQDRTGQHRNGNQMAVDNIRERLQIAYAGSATMQQAEQDERFTVTLMLPIKSEEVR